MNWKKLIGFGLLWWVIIFVVVSALMAFKFYSGILVEIGIAVLVGIIIFILAGYAKPLGLGQALTYGLVWAIIGLILDYFITLRYNDAIFKQWTLWLGYALVLLAPILRIKKSAESNSATVLE